MKYNPSMKKQTTPSLGRPPLPQGERMIQRAISMKPSQWAKVDQGGGQEWLRQSVDKSKVKPLL
jgi:hypothetical protein